MPAFTIRDHIKQVQAGGPGSGRRPGYGKFDLKVSTTGNHVHDIARGLGYSKSHSEGETAVYKHPDGHELRHANSFRQNYVAVQARGGSADDREGHVAKVEMALDKKDLLAY